MPEKAMSIIEKGVSFIYLNLLWFIGVMLGLVIGGFLPSSLTTQMMMEDEEFYSRYQSFVTITKKFFRLYISNFKMYWKLSILYSVVFAVLIVNLNVVFSVQELSFLIYITVIYSVYVLVHFLYLLPILPLASGKLSGKLKLALLAPLLHLKITGLNILLFFTVSVMLMFYPIGLVLIYPVGLLELSRRLNIYGLQEKQLIKLIK